MLQILYCFVIQKVILVELFCFVKLQLDKIDILNGRTFIIFRIKFALDWILHKLSTVHIETFL